MADGRNYLAEAVQIAAGGSRLLPQREHLMAMAAQLEAILADGRTWSEAVAVLMRFAKTTTFPISPAALMEVRSQRMRMLVRRLENGGIVIEQELLSAPLSTDATGKVM